MGNKIRIKQIDLQGFLSGSGQVDLLSASNYVSFVTQLDATMSSDSELAAVSSSISQSVYTIRQTLGSGLVSGSTQLTSSFDTRYTLSGSIPNIPTGSFATTGSNTFSGNQIISGSVGISANSGSWNFLQNGTLVLPNGTGIYGNGLLQIDVVGGFLLTSYTDQFGSGSQEWYFHSDGTLNVPGNIEGADNLLTTASFNTFTHSYYSTSASFDSRVESLENETSSYLTSLDGAISSSTQISDLGFVTGSYTTINSFNSLTQSFNSISQSFNVISGSVGTVDFSTLATTGSNIFKGEQIISSSLIVTNEIKGTGSIFLQPDVNDARKLQIYNTGAAPGDVHIKGTTGLTFLGDDTNYVAINDSAQTITITGSNGVYVGGIAETVGAFSQSVDSRLSNLQSTSASVNTSISNLNSATSSYETKGSGILSGSSQLNNTSIENLTIINLTTVNETASVIFSSGSNRFGDFGNDIHSFTGSVQVSGSTIITGSVSATSFNGTINSTNGVISGSSQLTSSYDTRYTLSGSVQPLPNGLISGSSQLTSSYDTRYTLSGSVGATPNGTISGSSQLTSSFDTRYVLSGSISAVPAGTISGSSQLTSSYDTRYVISGSVGATPSGTISGSAQITTFGFVSGSYETTGRGIISSSANLVTTSSYNADSASFDTRINSITVSSGSNLTYLLEAYANVTYTLPGGFTEDPCRYSVVSATENVPSNWFNTSTYIFTPQKAGYWEINAAYDVYRNGEASMAIRKNGSIVTSAGSFNAVAQDISKIIYLNGSTDYIDIVNTGGAALQRNQYQQRSWFQAKFVGNISGSTDLPAGVISGSSQLTSSFDTRYVASGSISATPSGTISGSSQLTSSFDLRYLVTGSVTSSITQLNSFTSSINSKTGSFATTGSNSFNGSQQITGSLVVSQNITGSASASFVSLAVNTTTPTQKIHLKGAVGVENGTTGGNTADQMIFGYAGSNLTQYTHKIQTGHDAQAALNRMDFLLANAASTWKTPLQLRHDRVIVSGSTYVSGDLIVTGSINGTINATNGVLSGSTQITPLLPAGTISGSSQLTSSYDSRYLTIGGDSVISGSSQLTSSYDGRYTQTGSFNTYTSSMNTWTSSLSAIGTLNVDYINAGRRTSDQTSTGNGSDIIFNSSIVSSGISLNTSTGVFTLTAGKTYKLFAELSFSIFSSTSGFIIYDWVDATTNTRLDTSGVSAGIGEAINRDTNEFNATSTTLIYTPTTNQNVKVRIVDALGTATIRADIGTKAIIEQINPSVALNQFATLQVSGSLTTTGSTISLGGITGSIAATNGVISGSSQLTSSYDSRYLTIGGDSVISGSSQLTSSFDTRYAISASFVSSSNVASIQTITSASYAALTPVSGTLYIIIG